MDNSWFKKMKWMIWGSLHLWKPSNVQYPSLPPWLWHDKCGVHRWGAQASLDHLKDVSWKDIIRKARGSCEILADSPEHRLGTINTRKHQEFYQPTRAEDFFSVGLFCNHFLHRGFCFPKRKVSDWGTVDELSASATQKGAHGQGSQKFDEHCAHWETSGIGWNMLEMHSDIILSYSYTLYCTCYHILSKSF